LYLLTSGVYHRVNVIDDDSHQRQRQQAEKGQLYTHVDHGKDDENKQHNSIETVHNGRTYVHTNAAYILCCPVHQVARVVSSIETHRQILVMSVDLILQIVLNMAGHQDDGLSHKEKEKSA